MRISEPIETTGTFWVPERPEDQLRGTLRISESGEVRLDVVGDMNFTFKDVHSSTGVSERLDRIVGKVEKGGPVTLDGCLYHLSKITSHNGPESTSRADLAFVGVNYNKEEETSFTEFRFSVEGLEEWLELPGIGRLPTTPQKGGSKQYRRIDPILQNLPDGISMNIIVESTTSPPFSQNSGPLIIRRAFISLLSEKPRDIEFFSHLAFKLCNFLSLALDQAVSIKSISVSSEQASVDTTTSVPPPIQVFGQFAPWTEQRPTVGPHRMLFTHREAKCRLKEDILTGWLKKYVDYEPAFDVYFLTCAKPTQMLETKFLQLTQGIEVLHNRTSPETTVMPKCKYRKFLASALCSVPREWPEDKQKWIRNKLHSANQLTLRERIWQMIEPFQLWFGNDEDCENFAKRIVDNRNHLTHYSSGTERRAAKVQELITLYEKLEALFRLHLLKFIGFDDKSIDSIVRSNARLCWQLRGGATDTASTEDQQP